MPAGTGFCYKLSLYSLFLYSILPVPLLYCAMPVRYTVQNYTGTVLIIFSMTFVFFHNAI